MSVGKKIGLIILSLILTVCVGATSWYAYIYFFGKDKVVSHTLNIGLQTLEDGSQKPLAEIQLFNNAYEFKWNYVVDENMTAFYSQGVQILGSDINWEYKVDPSTKNTYKDTGHLWWKEECRSYYGRSCLVSDNDYYTYASSNDYEDTINSVNVITDETLFKLTVTENGEDKVYGMKFKGTSTPQNATSLYKSGVKTYEGIQSQIDVYSDYYYYFDFNYFLELLYNSIQTLSPGVKHNIVFEFGDYFDYYEYLGDGVYSEVAVSLDKASLISQNIKSYWTIAVTIIDKDIEKASESLFNCVAGSPNYNITGNYSDDGYFFGCTLLNLDYNNFTRVLISDNYYALKLKQSFIDYNLKYSSQVLLKIVIDLDALRELNVEFVGFTQDSGLSNFNVYKCITIETINGELIESEVAYE